MDQLSPQDSNPRFCPDAGCAFVLVAKNRPPTRSDPIRSDPRMLLLALVCWQAEREADQAKGNRTRRRGCPLSRIVICNLRGCDVF